MRGERRAEIDYVKLGRALLEHAAMQDLALRAGKADSAPDNPEIGVPPTPSQGGSS